MGPQPRAETRRAGPFITLQRRAWGEPISHLILGRGALPFTTWQSTRKPRFFFFLPEGMAPRDSPKREGTPWERGDQLPLLYQAGKPNLNSLPPQPRAPINAITYLRKAEGPLPLKIAWGRVFAPKRGRGFQRGKGSHPPPQFLPP